MHYGFNPYGFAPFNTFFGADATTSYPSGYTNDTNGWNTPFQGGFTNGWNAPVQGSYTSGWNVPFYGGTYPTGNTPFQGSYTSGWNAPFYGGTYPTGNTPVKDGFSSDWNAPYYGTQSFSGFGNYAPNTTTTPGGDPVQNVGGPFWTGSCTTEAA